MIIIINRYIQNILFWELLPEKIGRQQKPSKKNKWRYFANETNYSRYLLNNCENKPDCKHVPII
ncbi:hypothetical protein O3M35_012379 [Rhynocoris fuscipes]|uniref:Ycf1 n=1 Tax=Rhynocoris fuscipes TaxID=488301 RepID=A0AAW1CS67_9HEMI